MTPQIQAFFDPATATVTYVVHEADGQDCAIIDSVLDYDPKAGRTSTTSADKVIAFVRERLGPVQTPKRIHFHASLPRSPVGKVLKSAVRDLALATA